MAGPSDDEIPSPSPTSDGSRSRVLSAPASPLTRLANPDIPSPHSGPAGNKKHFTAKDVWHFYDDIGARRICTACRYVIIAIFYFDINDVSRDLKKINAKHEVKKYGANTSTGVLRTHLMECHLSEWGQFCEEQDVELVSKAAQKAMDKYRGNGKSHSKPDARMPFSKEAFVDAIAAFIISDDIVSLYPR
jgi:hypothetical protein